MEGLWRYGVYARIVRTDVSHGSGRVCSVGCDDIGQRHVLPLSGRLLNGHARDNDDADATKNGYAGDIRWRGAVQ